MSEITEEIGALDRMAARERDVATVWLDGTSDDAQAVMDEFLRLRSMQQRHFARGLRAANFEAERQLCVRCRASHRRGSTKRGALERVCAKLAFHTPAQRLISSAHLLKRRHGPTREQLAELWGAAWQGEGT